MDCLPVCQRGLPKKVGIRYNEHNSNMNEATVNKTDITVRYLRSYEPTATATVANRQSKWQQKVRKFYEIYENAGYRK